MLKNIVMKRCSTLYIIRKMKIKTTMRYRYTPTVTPKLWDTDKSKHWWVCGAPGTLVHCWWECKMVQTLCKTVWWLLTRKTYVFHMSRNCIPWYLHKGVANLCPHKHLHADVYISFIHNCQNLEAIKMSFGRWMNKWTVIHPMEYFSVLKRNELSSHEKTWKNLKCTLLNERR